MKTIVINNVYRLLRIEEEDGQLYKREILKTLDLEQLLYYARKELEEKKDIYLEVW